MSREAKLRVACAARDEVAEMAEHAFARTPRSARTPVVLGLGTGSTARLFVEALASWMRAKDCWEAVAGVPTSQATRELATRLGIPLLDDQGPWDIDVNVDGADEVSAALDLIKGGGGAHAREKIVNFASRKNVVIVDAKKMSARLGEQKAVPIEVLPFAHATTQRHLAKLGEPTLRQRGGVPLRTDAGNFIYDLRVPPLEEPGALDRALHAVPGVVETGLFVGRADVVLIGNADGVRRLLKSGPSALTCDSRRAQ